MRRMIFETSSKNIARRKAEWSVRVYDKMLPQVDFFGHLLQTIEIAETKYESATLLNFKADIGGLLLLELMTLR